VMDGQGKSDRPVVPAKLPNNVVPAATAEVVEGRGLAKGNTGQQNAPRTQSRTRAPSALDRVREASAFSSRPEAGAQCGSSARWDLSGGRPEPLRVKGRPYRDRSFHRNGLTETLRCVYY
jgi:hypothetical protein